MLIAKTLVELKRGCPDSLALGRSLEGFCTRNCAETLFSVILMFALIIGTWSGWEWNRGLVDLEMEWGRRKNAEWKEMELKKSKESEDTRRRGGDGRLGRLLGRRSCGRTRQGVRAGEASNV
jgi:hypothetical protein